MDELIGKKERIIEDNENEIKRLKDEIQILKEGDNNNEIKKIILRDRKELYQKIRINIPHNMRNDEIFLRDEEVKECNEILEEFDNKFNITKVDLKGVYGQKYRFL
jgi:hypothetical protein